MATESIISMRGFAKITLALLLLSVCLCTEAWAGANPSVVATGPLSAVATHPAFEVVWNTAISPWGDLFVMDFSANALYEFPAGGGAEITIVPSGSFLGGDGGWTVNGVAVNPVTGDVLVGNNWSNCYLWDIPYVPATHSWNAAAAYQYGQNATNGSPVGGWCHPDAISFNASGTVAFGNENSFDGIIEIPAGAPAASASIIATGLKSRPKSIALDNAGNIYFLEDGGTEILRVAASQSGLTGEALMTRVDPVVGGSAVLSNIDGVSVDANGNVYISDSVLGVLFVPNESGTPNPSDAVFMSAVPATANVTFDLTRGIMYVPVPNVVPLPSNSKKMWGWKSAAGVVYYDIAGVALSNVNLGTAAIGVQGTFATINVGFAADTTLASIEILETGATTDFTVLSGGTCKANTYYAAGSTCTVEVALNSQTIGNVSGKLELLDGSSNILASLSLSGMGVPPAVVSGPASALTSPKFEVVWNTAISPWGDLFVMDFSANALYEFPAGGGARITIVPSGSFLGGDGGWTVNGVAVNPVTGDVLVGNNWSNCYLWDIPYVPATHSWNAAAAYQYGQNATNGSPVGGWCHPDAISFNASGTAAFGNENSFDGIIEIPAGSPSASAVIIATGLKSRPRSIALDNAGNIYFFEDGGAPGILRVAAGQSGLTGEASMTEVDPMEGGSAALSNIDGVSVDAAGNVYISDSVMGVVLVPNENGTPNPNDAYLLSPVPASTNVEFDLMRGIMYVPTAPGSANGIDAIAMSNVNLGSVALGSQGAAQTVNVGLSAGVTPAKITIEEAGVKTPDFTVLSSGTCAAGTSYAALSTCSVNLALSPLHAGEVSGKLQLLDAENNTIALMPLNGIGQGPAITVSPSLESAIGSGLVTPTAVATDAMGNVYVADSGLKKVLMYPPGASSSTAGVSVGQNLTGPTGVAVDGAGDVFIADTSGGGTVYEVPYTPSGLNTAGQLTLYGGLGTGLSVVADGLGDVYVGTPQNAEVLELVNAGVSFGPMSQTLHYISGFTAPSAVAVDESNNLYVIDSGKLLEVTPSGVQTTLLTGLSGVTGVAVDPSGAVYLAMPGGAVRIPYVSGALNQSALTAVAASVTNPMGLALDQSGNVYLADGTAKNLHLVSINGLVSTGSPAIGSVGTAIADVMNIGNAPLTVTGFLSSDAEDFSATGCSASVIPSGTCTVNVTMNPGAGIQGSLSTVITIQSNAANAAVVDASGVGAALAASKTTISVGSTANVLSIPVTVTVVPASGSGVTPTGQVVVSVDGVAQAPATLTNGTVTIPYTGLTAASHTFSVQYIGNRVYGASTASITTAIAKGLPSLTLPTPPTYSISTTQDGDVPYNTTVFGAAYYTNYLVTVVGTGSVVPTGKIFFMQGTTAVCGNNSDGSFTLGAGSNAANVPNAPGTMTFNPGCLPIAQNTVAPDLVTPQLITSVVYNGDANYLSTTATTTSAGKPILFEELRNPAVAITPNPGTLSITAGTGSATLTIASVLGYGGVNTNPVYPLAGGGQQLNNYTLPLGFACQGLPAHATCTFTGGNYTDANGLLHADELNVNNDPAVTQTIKVTVNTNVSAGTTTSQISQPAPFEFAALFGVGLAGLAFGRKSGRGRRVLMLLCLVILTGAIAGITACNTANLGTSPVLTTPSGSYAVIVTAQEVGSAVVPGAQGPVTVYGSQNQISLPYTLNVTVQ